MVNSISKTVQSLIDRDLSLQEALFREYGNYSAIARMLKPKAEEMLGCDVKLESLITSVKRAKKGYKPLQENITKVVAQSVINIKTDVAKISFEKTRRNLEKMRKTLMNFPEESFQIIEGIAAVTLIFDQILFGKIFSCFRENEILDKKKSLATIIIRSPNEIIGTPGCILVFYNTISRRHINIEETMSCSTDTIIVLAMEDVSKAFEALTDQIAEARRQMG